MVPASYNSPFANEFWKAVNSSIISPIFEVTLAPTDFSIKPICVNKILSLSKVDSTPSTVDLHEPIPSLAAESTYERALSPTYIDS